MKLHNMFSFISKHLATISIVSAVALGTVGLADMKSDALDTSSWFAPSAEQTAADTMMEKTIESDLIVPETIEVEEKTVEAFVEETEETTAAPTTEATTTAEETTAAPTTEATTTVEETTAAPTTEATTTVEETTAAPTTEATTTVEQTTAAPTTEATTTVEETTAAPTTEATTTVEETTAAPETTTEAPTEAPTTEAPKETEAPKDGGSLGDLSGQYNNDMARAILEYVNDTRAANGLGKLSWDGTLAKAANIRASEIVVKFSHTRPDGSEWWTAGAKTQLGENLAYGQSSVQAAFEAWMNSPTHRANILEGYYTKLGVSCYYCNGTYWWVQEFA